jgi:N-carbamoylputrescine amidase
MAAHIKDLCVAAVQMASENCEVEANLQRAGGLAEEAARLGAELVVFPEFMPTGYIFTREIWNAAEPHDGPTIQWLRKTSKRLGVWLGTSFLEAQGEDFFNTFALTDPDGREAGRVRKQTPAAVEAYFFKGEKGDHVIRTDIGNIGIGICYENQLSYLPRLMYSHSVDILLMPHSAPSFTPHPLVRTRTFEAYSEVLRALPAHHARMLGVPVVFVNRPPPAYLSTGRTRGSPENRRSLIPRAPSWPGSGLKKGSSSRMYGSIPRTGQRRLPVATGAGR